MRSSARRALLVACLAAAPALRAEEPASTTVVERILAVVEGTPILLSEVALLERLRGVPRAEALEVVIDERLMFREAVRLSQTALTAEEEERAFEGLRANARGAGTEAELRRLARRQAAILKYVDFRFRPQVRIDDEAVRREWEADHPGDAPPSAAEGEASIFASSSRAGAGVRYNP